MKKLSLLFICLLLLSAASALFAQQQKPPIMGWSSWNHFHVNIDEKMIREQADAGSHLECIDLLTLMTGTSAAEIPPKNCLPM